MQRLKLDPAGPSSQEEQQLQEEEAINAKWNVISSFAAFGAIVFLLRVGKNGLQCINWFDTLIYPHP